MAFSNSYTHRFAPSPLSVSLALSPPLSHPHFCALTLLPMPVRVHTMSGRRNLSRRWLQWIDHRQHLRTVQPMPCWDVCKRWLHQRPRYILRRYHSVSGSSCDRVRGENVFCYSLLSSYLLPPSPLSFQPRRPCHFSRCDLPHCRVQPV